MLVYINYRMKIYDSTPGDVYIQVESLRLVEYTSSIGIAELLDESPSSCSALGPPIEPCVKRKKIPFFKIREDPGPSHAQSCQKGKSSNAQQDLYPIVSILTSEPPPARIDTYQRYRIMSPRVHMGRSADAPSIWSARAQVLENHTRPLYEYS